MSYHDYDDDWLTTGEVADRFRVDPKTASRWATSGRFPDLDDGHPSVIRTPGGHLRVRRRTVQAILTGQITFTYGRGVDAPDAA